MITADAYRRYSQAYRQFVHDNPDTEIPFSRWLVTITKQERGELDGTQ